SADEKLPPFDDYAMKERTYRYFTGQPLFPFGHGLSYTSFGYSGLKLDRTRAGAGDEVAVSVTVKNQGKRAGDEVVQLYLAPVKRQRQIALKDQRGFQRVLLQQREARTVTVSFIPERDLRVHDESAGRYTVEPGRDGVQVGASSADVRARVPLEINAL